MSPEKSAGTFALFPIGEDATREARTWVQYRLHSPAMQDTEIEKLKNSNPELFIYLQKLGTLRSIVQFDNDPKTQRAYWNGAFYVMEALNKQYDFLFKDTPTPSQEIMKTHFFNLIDVENNHGAALSFAPGIFEEESFAGMMDSFLDGYGDKTFDEIAKFFAVSSQYLVHEVFDENPQLGYILTRTSINQTHGPALGLVYGALDVYEIFRIHEEGNQLSQAYEIPMK